MATRTFPLPFALRPRRAAGAGPRSPRRHVPHPGPRIVAVVVLVALLLAGGWWWGRDSSLVAVREVRIAGLTTGQTAAVRSALTDAAHDMTTLHVREGLLRDAVGAYPVVAEVHAEGDFPHLLKITVVEHRAVAVLRAGSRSVPVAADGTLLRGLTLDRAPIVTLDAPPAGTVLKDKLALAQVRILAAAPAALRDRVTRMFTGARGMQAQLQNGPVIAFGAPDRLAAKWAALTAVLADPSSAGATLIDLTVPESPAAAGLEPMAATDTAATGPVDPVGAAATPTQPPAATTGAPAATTTP